MKQFIRQERKILIAALLTLGLVCTGIVMVFRVFQQYESLIIENQDRQLLGLARSVDRSINSYLQQFVRDLEHTVGRTGLEEAEAAYRNGGSAAGIGQNLQDTALWVHPLTYDMLCMDGEAVVYSAQGRTDYTFPARAGLDGETRIGPCIDGSGAIYLSFLKSSGGGLQYGVLVSLTDFYQAVAGNLIAGTQDRILLLDAGGRAVLYQTQAGTGAALLSDGLPDGVYSDELDILLDCQRTGAETAVFYQAGDGREEGYTARMAALPAAGSNGVFSVGVSLNYETVKRPIHMATIRLAAYSSMIIIGILLLLTLILFAARRDVRAQQEVLTLRERNLALEAVTKKTQALAHHQRLEIIGTLTSSIAHEFNNLLTPIMGYSILVLEKLPPDAEELYDNVLEIYEASRKAKTIISRLSDLSRKNTPLTFQYVAPDELVRRVLEISAPARPPRVEVGSRLHCRHLWVRGNEIQLSQMLLNLILNAYQAMETDGGTLTVTTGQDGDAVCFHVADTGPGIDPSLLEHIFEPFFTTKERGKGTGLGLAIVQQVVQDHQGSVSVHSQPGQGTTITVRLPLPPPDPERGDNDL